MFSAPPYFDPNACPEMELNMVNSNDKILLVHGDDQVGGAIARFLAVEGFSAVLAADAEAALKQALAYKPQLILIDLPLPGVSGVELCMQLRNSRIQTPVIVISADSKGTDEILFLESGADDCLVKPFGTRELLARIRAILRRTKAPPGRTLRFGDVEIDVERRRITRRGNNVQLTPCEYNLLLFFLQNVDRALSREAILTCVWGYDQSLVTRTVDAHVSKLRNKFEDQPAAPRHFLTVHGIGYRFLM